MTEQLSESRPLPNYALFELDGEKVMLYAIHPTYGLAIFLDVKDAEYALEDFVGENSMEHEMLFYGPEGQWWYSKRANEGALR